MDLILHRSPTPMPTSLNRAWSVGVVSLIAIADRQLVKRTDITAKPSKSNIQSNKIIMHYQGKQK
ncbi:hypothetical protein K2X05_05690 [bacterium]|nr:hypothetical protein [bacterium]